MVPDAGFEPAIDKYRIIDCFTIQLIRNSSGAL